MMFRFSGGKDMFRRLRVSPLSTMRALREADLLLLGRWEQAYKEAQKAESAVFRIGLGTPRTAELCKVADECRKMADALFAELLQRQAFGFMLPMPKVRPPEE